MVSYEAVNSGERLDVFLTEQNQDFSRSHVQKLIADGKVMVNGQQRKANFKLTAGDEITLEIPEAVEPAATARSCRDFARGYSTGYSL